MLSKLNLNYIEEKLFSIILLFFIVTVINSCKDSPTNTSKEGNEDTTHANELKNISSPPCHWINSLAINSKGDFFAGTDKGLFISSDCGKNWMVLLDSAGKYFDVDEIKITDNGFIFILYITEQSSNILRSTDNGNSWEISLISPHEDLRYPFSKIETDLNGNIYVCRWTGIYKSSDKGNSWELFNKTYVRDIFFPNKDTILVGINGPFRGEIMISTDNGKSWDSTNCPINVNYFIKYNSLIFTGGTAADEGGGGIYKSDNSGKSWKLCGLLQNSIYCFVINNGNKLFAGTYTGIYFTQDEGKTWQVSLRDSVITSLMTDNKNYLYASTSRSTFLRSTDDGITWQDK